MEIEVGVTYIGKARDRRTVMEVTDTRVTYLFPISLRVASSTLKQFEAWAVGIYEPLGADVEEPSDAP